MTLYVIAEDDCQLSKAAKNPKNFFGTLQAAKDAAIMRRGETGKKQVIMSVRLAWIGWENNMSYQYEDDDGKSV
jgi:hypothetical protein